MTACIFGKKEFQFNPWKQYHNYVASIDSSYYSILQIHPSLTYLAPHLSHQQVGLFLAEHNKKWIMWYDSENKILTMNIFYYLIIVRNFSSFDVRLQKISFSNAMKQFCSITSHCGFPEILFINNISNVKYILSDLLYSDRHIKILDKFQKQNNWIVKNCCQINC